MPPTGSPVGTIFSQNAVTIQELISKSVGLLMPSLDPIWRDTIVSNQDVGPVDQMGRDHLIVKTYKGGVTGVIEPGGPGADFTLYGDNSNTSLGAKLFTQGISKMFPDPTGGMNQQSYRLGVPMRSMVTNIMSTLGEMQAEANAGFIGEIVAPKMAGFALNLSQFLCNSWYVSQNTQYSLTWLGTGSVTATYDTNTTVVIDLTLSNYSVDRFLVGQRVQFYSQDGETLRNTGLADANGVFVVVGVQELQGKIRLKALNNDTLTAWANSLTKGASGTGDIIVPAGSKGSSVTPFASSPYFTGIAGINSWLKFGDSNGSTDGAANCLLGGERVGTLYGFSHNINVNTHPEFASMLYDNGSTALTEHTLRKLLRRWHVAKHKYGQSIDCLIASDGVWLAYEAEKIQRQWFDRTNRVSSINNEGSEEGMKFTLDGRTYEGYWSTYIESGTMYGIRRKGNWRRYCPRDINGVKKFDKAESWNPFRFVAPALTGQQSIWMPISQIQNGRTMVTEALQAPGYLRMQLVPDQPAGLKITGLAEDRAYGTTS